MTDTDAITDIRVEPIGNASSFEIMGTRNGDPTYMGNVTFCPSSPYHFRTETEARLWAQLFAGALPLLRAAQEFCRRVESGEIRSKRTYEAFKAAISEATKIL